MSLKRNTRQWIPAGRPFGTSCAKASSRAFRSRARLGRDDTMDSGNAGIIGWNNHE